MTPTEPAANSAGSIANAVETRPWIERLAQIGWIAKGVVYTLMGMTTIQIARQNPTAKDASPEGSIGRVGEAPYGRSLLAVLAVGLLLYATWRILSVAATHGRELSDWAHRIGYSFSGIFYLVLAWTAASAAMSGDDPEGSNSVETISRTVLELAAGRLLLGVAGIATIALGAYFALHNGVRRSFVADLDGVDDSPHHTAIGHSIVLIAGVLGWIGRGIVTALVGFFVARSAFLFDPNEARGFDRSLREVAGTPTGTALVFASAVGLIAYGLFCLASHRLRTLETPGHSRDRSTEQLTMPSAGPHTNDHGSPLLVLGPLLRWVDDRSATIWVETSRACNVEVLGHTAPTFRVHDHHYALVVVEGLEAGSTTLYEVHLDGAAVWPRPDDRAPPSVIRSTGGSAEVRVLVGSCRAAAPHEPPYTQDLAFNAEGRGVDTLWAHAQQMKSQDTSSWPTLVVFAGDQIYADDSSPKARERIERERADTLDLDSSKVYDFEEYCWLYHEAWSAESERWFLSTVPSTMIFDDHDMIDDWNISASWVADMQDVDTWRERAVNGLMSYWIYQHLGNLAPAQIQTEGLLERLTQAGDGTEILRAWAAECFDQSADPGGYQFSHVRQTDRVTVIVIDCRNGRVFNERDRLMVQRDEWTRIRQAAMDADNHVLIVTSVPVFLSDGIHDLHTWNERICNGAWGPLGRHLGERIRRSLDLEDWPAFPESFQMFRDLIADMRNQQSPPRSIIVASGDIHFSYAARVTSFATGTGPDVWQVVSSPIRNALIPHERGAMRFTFTTTGALVGRTLRRLSRSPDTRPNIDIEAGPFFANNMCQLRYTQESIDITFEQSTSSADAEPDLTEVGNIRI